MNIQTLNAHLKLLGPAPKGMKWRMVKEGKVLEVGDMRCDPSQDYKDKTVQAGAVFTLKALCNHHPNARYWRLVPSPAPAWHKDPLDITHDILPTADLRRETVDGIIADFIKTVSDEKTFRAYLRAAKKGLTEADYD